MSVKCTGGVVIYWTKRCAGNGKAMQTFHLKSENTILLRINENILTYAKKLPYLILLTATDQYFFNIGCVKIHVT